MHETKKSPFTWLIITVIGILYASAFIITFIEVGPWQAVRKVGVQALIVSLWLVVAHLLLSDTSDTDLPIKHKQMELIAGGIIYGLMVGGAALAYTTDHPALRWALWVIMYIPLLVLVLLKYDRQAFGLNIGSGKAWIVVLAVIVINGLIGTGANSILPPGELPSAPGSDLAEQINSVMDALRLLGIILVVAAIPEEFYFRIYLQPRLSVSLGWAILIQSILFNAAHLPQQLINYDHSLLVALANTLLTPANGLISGYLWRKTRSLPILIVVHLLAFPRFGL